MGFYIVNCKKSPIAGHGSGHGGVRLKGGEKGLLWGHTPALAQGHRQF